VIGVERRQHRIEPHETAGRMAGVLSHGRARGDQRGEKCPFHDFIISPDFASSKIKFVKNC
jgi:hypothetical protein